MANISYKRTVNSGDSWKEQMLMINIKDIVDSEVECLFTDFILGGHGIGTSDSNICERYIVERCERFLEGNQITDDGTHTIDDVRWLMSESLNELSKKLK